MKKVSLLLTLLVFISNTMFICAQNGPGGVGNKKGTNSQPRNILWLDANSLGFANGANVSVWSDKSGNGNDAVQPIAGQQPIFSTSIINSKPVVSFDNTGGAGNEDFMTYDGNIIVNTDLTVMFVAARRTLGNKYVLAGNDNEANKNLHMPWKSPTTAICNHYGNDIDDKTLNAGNNVVNVFSIFTDRLASTEVAPQRRFIQDGSELGNISNANKLLSYNGAAIARNSFNDGATYSYHDVDVAEIIYFTTALNSAQQLLVNNYLNAKYGMTIAAGTDKYSITTNYIYDVAGIGKESDGSHLLGGLAGLYLQSNAGLDNGEYLMTGNNNTLNDAPTTSDLPVLIQERWKRDWYIEKTGSHDDKIIFDFPEGITAGQYPQNVSNYVLLYRATTSGNYAQVTTTSVGLADNDQVVFEVSDANLVNGYYTIGTIDNINSPLIGKAGLTWYTLVSGNWNDPTIWTLDPSGALPNNPSNLYPSLNSDKVVIKDGRTIVMNINNVNCDQLTVEGRLDLANSTGQNFTSIRGNGIILIAGDNFPTGDATHFISKGQGEGTVEYYGTSRTIATTHTFFNLKVNLTNATDTLTLIKDITANGYLNLQKGIFKINDNALTTILNVMVAGDVTISNTAGIAVGRGNTIGTYAIPGTMPGAGLYHSIFHQFNIGGNFTNNGTIRFTNQANYVFDAFSTTGAVTVRFTGASNALATLDGITDFYNLIVDKGTDQTYILEINSSNVSNFRLFGANSVGRTGNAENPEVRKALWIKNGTLKLAGNIFIPSLSEGQQVSGNGDYAIGANAQLWIAGSGVTIYCTADNTNHPIAGAIGINNTGSNQALSVYGTYRITNGYFNSGYSAGLIFWNSATSSAEILIDGGITNVSVFRSASAGAGKTSYIQTGGTLIVRGDEGERGEVDGAYPLFGLIEAPSTFNMSGGDIIIRDRSTAGTNNYFNNGVYINSTPENISVTGGKITISTNTTYSPVIDIFSNAELWNLDIARLSGSATTTVKLAKNILIQNDLNINAYGELYANNFDVSIGGNFMIAANGKYTPENNTTLFTGKVTKTFTNNGTINPKLNNLTINKPTATLNLGSAFTCNGSLNIIAGTLNDAGFTLTVNKDITNSGIHTGTGKILLNGAGIVSGITITTPPGVYKTPPTVTIAPPTIGITATGTPILNGSVDIITITNGGTGYTGTPTITFSSSPTGNTATGTVILSSGEITGITITNHGSGYQNAPTFTLGNLGGGSGAVLTLEMSYTVIGVAITNSGSGYTAIPIVTFSFGTPSATGDAIIYTKHAFAGNGSGQFNNIELDETNAIITSPLNANQQINGTLTMTNGILDLGIYNLNLMGNISPNTLADYSITKMIRTAGNNSDRGLTRYINANNSYIYPLGTNANSINRYTPSLMTVSSYSDDGNLTLRPVDKVLTTTLSTSGNILSYYWRTNNTNFTTKPKVTYTFNYTESDLDGAADETSFVPGKVLEVSPFTRSSEAIGNMNTTSNTITFNGGGSPFDIEDASYTAGMPPRFTGAPTVYYLRDNSNWNNNSTWSLTRGGGAASNYPKAGDIAVIRRFGVSYTGLVTVNNAESAARVIFDDENGWSSGCPRVIFSNTASYNSSFDVVEVAPTHQGGELNGSTHGAVIQYYVDGSYTGQFPTGDFNLFNRYINALVIYVNTAPAGTIVPLSIQATEYPQFWTDLSTAGNYMMFPSTNVTVHGMAYVAGNCQVLTSSGAGNIIFEKQLYIGTTCCRVGKFLFHGSATTNNTITVNGDIGINEASTIGIYNATGGGRTHTLIAKGNITLNTNTNVFNLGDGNTTNTNVTLELQGSSDNIFTNLGGAATPTLYRIVMNKGNSQANNFTFNTNFTLTGSSNGILKPLELQNGQLILNNPSIDITLSSGGGNFIIPGSTGLIVNQGMVRISGANTGISLDGLLKVDNTGQVLLDGGAVVDNFIEYSSSGDASIQVGGSGVLTVGSQIRRSPTSTVGILKYSQTGGTVIVGKNAAPINQRGVFEILNNGSDYTYTGGIFTICRSQTNPSIASLYLDPQTSNVGVGTTINIGDATNTPVSQTIGIYSSIPLNALTVNSFHSPTAKIWVVPLTLNGNLTISTGAFFNANGLTLNCKGNFTNAGTFIPVLNTTIFNGSATQTITGNTNFYNLTKSNANILNLNSGNTALDIDNVMNLLGGTIIDNGNTISVQGNCNIDGTHQHSGSGKGIMLNGISNQTLTGNGTFGLLTISNSAGVDIPINNQINIANELMMEKGVLNIGKNLLVLKENCIITPANPFSTTNMIQTFTSFTDNGVKKFLPSGASTFLYPMGTSGKYTPVSITITSNTNVGGSLTIKPADENHPSVLDVNNVLHYYWVLKANGLVNYSAEAKMKYIPTDVMVTGINTVYDYITARLLNDGTGNWNKFDVTGVNEPTNELVFSFSGTNDAGITGEYTAGIDVAIPNQVASYITKQNGLWTNVSTWETYPIAGGPIPVGGPRGSITYIQHTVTIPSNYISSYQTNFSATGILNVGTSYGHRLGYVNGNGKIIQESGILPAGVYDDFFSTSKGTIEFTGNTDYDILSDITSLNNIILSGTGKRRFANHNFQVLGNFNIAGADVVNENSCTFSVKGNIGYSGGTFTANSGKLILNGASLQTISGTSSFTGTNAFYNFEINNAGGANVVNNIDISNGLALTQGLLNISSGKTLAITNNSSTAVSGGSTTSYINGKMAKKAFANDGFVFPIGNAAQYKRIEIIDGVPATTWSTQFLGNNSNSTIETAPVQDIVTVSTTDRWYLGCPISATGKVKLYWNSLSGVGSDASKYPNLRVAMENAATKWISMGQSAYSGIDATFGTVTSNSVSFSDHYFTLASTLSTTPLPIELLSFNAFAKATTVEVDWTTATETNNDYFVVERSADAENFTFLKTLPGAGNSNELLNYQCFDESPLSGTSYYRLKQVDFDGKYAYSKVVSVTFYKNSITNQQYLNAYPNPTTGQLIIEISPESINGTLSIMDSKGTLVKKMNIFETIQKIDISNLPVGPYVLLYSTGKSFYSQRIIKF